MRSSYLSHHRSSVPPTTPRRWKGSSIRARPHRRKAKNNSVTRGGYLIILIKNVEKHERT